jgi:hypothetical protein
MTRKPTENRLYVDVCYYFIIKEHTTKQQVQKHSREICKLISSLISQRGKWDKEEVEQLSLLVTAEGWRPSVIIACDE